MFLHSNFLILAVLQPNRNIHSSYLNVSSCGASRKSEKSEHDELLCMFAPNVHDFAFATIRKNDVVELSAVEDHNILWIRSIEYDENYIDLMSKINVIIDDPVPEDELEDDTVVLIKHHGDYSRGIVLDKESISIQLMDIGSIVNADIRE